MSCLNSETVESREGSSLWAAEEKQLKTVETLGLDPVCVAAERLN